MVSIKENKIIYIFILKNYDDLTIKKGSLFDLFCWVEISQTTTFEYFFCHWNSYSNLIFIEK